MLCDRFAASRKLPQGNRHVHGVSRVEAKIGRGPGITQQVSFFPISNKPKLYVYDTPGVSFLKDKMENDRQMRLAAIGCFDDKVYSNMTLADYILFRLNKMRNFQYVDFFELAEPTNNVRSICSNLAERMGALQNFEDLFRSGELGRICLDDIPSEGEIEKLRNLLQEAEPPGPWGPANYGSEQIFAGRHLLRAKADLAWGIDPTKIK
eukprot:gene688-753_t